MKHDQGLIRPQWALVLAGVSDFARPAESLSLTQNLALMGTGAIWTRWCFVIKPRNVLYAFYHLCTPLPPYLPCCFPHC